MTRDVSHPVFVGRQAVFDAKEGLVGFQLRFRHEQAVGGASITPDEATVELLRTALVDIGIDHLIGHHLAFLTLPSVFFDSQVLATLPADRTVLEIPADWALSDALMEATAAIRTQGFRLAIAEVHLAPDQAALASVSDLVRVSMSGRTSAALSAILERARALGLKVLADGIDSDAARALCRSLGVDYCQGSFLSCPSLVKGHRIGGSEMVLLRLLDALQWPDTTDEQIERLVTSDASLSLEMLKLVNSPRFRRRQTIESVRHALMLLGRRMIGQWAMLLALGSVSGNPHKVELALIRARMGYLIAVACGREGDADRFFTLGLLSAIERLFGMPLADIARYVNLGEEMSAALLRREGFMGLTLEAIEAFEFEGRPIPDDLGAPVEDISDLYLRAVRWARERLAELARHPG